MLWSFYLPNTSLQGYTECLALYEGEPIPHMVRIEDDKGTQRTTPITMQSIHITTLRKILSSPEPIDIRLWTRSGEIQSWHRCISLRYDFYKGTRRMKLLDSNEIRQLRDACIFEVNGIEVYM